MLSIPNCIPNRREKERVNTKREQREAGLVANRSWYMVYREDVLAIYNILTPIYYVLVLLTYIQELPMLLIGSMNQESRIRGDDKFIIHNS